MSLNERHFESLGYPQRQELVQLCSLLPVLPREDTDAFFNEAKRVTKGRWTPWEGPASMLFNNLGGLLLASDRQDFDARWQLGSQSIADGVLMVETYDSVIPTLQCVARVSEDSFLTRIFNGERDIAPVKRLTEHDKKTTLPADSKQELEKKKSFFGRLRGK